jgi:hypothetical protein
MQLMHPAPAGRGALDIRGMRKLKLLLAAGLAGTPALADVLPEDRADALYHLYDGGGITVQGPSVLVRKKVGDSVSLSASYYADIISGASIDVLVSGASPYRETRQQWGGSVDYQHGKTTYSVGFINSNEPDYKAKTAYGSLSQNMFGDLTTVTLGFQREWDIVLRNIKNPITLQIENDPTFRKTADRRAYTFGLSQVLTRNLLGTVNYEKITDSGYLANPYRQIRYLNPDGIGFTLANQVYPNTRTSDAVSGQLKYYLPYRAALTGTYRYYNDTYGINGQTLELSYIQPTSSHWTLNAFTRYYTQTHATFYSDLFPRANYSNFMARDRELAAFDGVTLGLGFSYEMQMPGTSFLQKSSVNVHYDRLMIDYHDFRNALDTQYAAGTEPLYHLDANILQVFFSVWY